MRLGRVSALRFRLPRLRREAALEVVAEDLREAAVEVGVAAAVRKETGLVTSVAECHIEKAGSIHSAESKCVRCLLH